MTQKPCSTVCTPKKMGARVWLRIVAHRLVHLDAWDSAGSTVEAWSLEAQLMEMVGHWGWTTEGPTVTMDQTL